MVGGPRRWWAGHTQMDFEATTVPLVAVYHQLLGLVCPAFSLTAPELQCYLTLQQPVDLVRVLA